MLLVASPFILFIWNLGLQVASVIDMFDEYSDREKVDDEELFRRVKHDPYVEYAVMESYDLLKDVLCGIVIGEHEKR